MAKEKKIEAIEPKLIDVEGLMNGTVELSTINYDVMMADALARKSKEGALFLREQQAVVKERKLKSGKTVMARQSVAVYRAKYLHDYAGFKTKNELASEQRTIINRNKDIEEKNALADLVLSMIEG